MATDTLRAESAHVTTMPTLDRRAFIGAAPVVAAAAAVPALAIGTARHDWEAAMRAYELAKAEDAAFQPAYERVHAAWEAGRPSMDGISFKEFPYRQRDHVARTMKLDAEWRCFLAGEGEWWFSADPESRKAEFRAALDTVQAFRDAEAKHDRESGMDAAEERWEALGDRVADATWALMAIPAPDLAALRWKLDYLMQIDGSDSTSCWSAASVAQTRADIGRLLGSA